MSPDPAQYDPFDPAIHDHPDPWYDLLRERCPVHHEPKRDFYTLTATADITAVLQRPSMWSSRFRNGLTYRPPSGEPMLLDADPPTHTWQRRLLQKAWTPRYIRLLEQRARTIVGERFDEIAPRGHGDYHADIAGWVPVAMIAELVGVPPQDRARFKQWSDAKVEVTAGTPGAEAGEAIADREVTAYFEDHIARRRADLVAGRDLPDDYTTMILTARHDGLELDDLQVRRILQLLMLGGIETTTLLLSNLLHRVIVEPGLAGTLRAEPGLIEIAVEECLRLDSPTLGLFRTPNEDCPVRGVTIPKDAKAMVMYAAANRDPALWNDSHSFRLDRDPLKLRQHFAFGHGIHLCLGAPLARLEGAVVLDAIVKRLPNIRYTEPPMRVPTMIFRGYNRQQTEWDVAAAS